MSSIPRPLPALALGAVLASTGCAVNPPKGTNIGALREPDPSPAPPTDVTSLDMRAAVEEALRVGSLTTLSAAWGGHKAALDGAPADCPQIWIGPLPPDLVDFDIDGEEPGMSWVASCVTPTNVSFAGFSHWVTAVAPDRGDRQLAADASVLDGDGGSLFEFDGTASDSLDLGAGTYASTMNGELKGSLVGLGAGFRTGGDFEASWSTDGSLRFFGTMTSYDGFGPPDDRDPTTSPELEDVVGWTAGMPRFTSVRFDLEFTPDCAEEPAGYVGLRGNEGFWFDVYFLPKPDVEPGSAQANAFPYEDIENVSCDGIGTLFARNVDLASLEAENAGWSREISPDFAGVVASLVMPTLDSYIFTIRDLVE